MKHNIKLFVSLILFLLIFFYIQQLVFLLGNINQVYKFSLGEVSRGFYHSFPLQIAAISYIFIVPLLIFFIGIIWRQNAFIKKTLLIYFYIIISLNCLITAVDIGLFHSWSNKINAKAINYLIYPKQTIGAIEGGFHFLLLLLAIGQAFWGIYIFRKLFERKIIIQPSAWWMALIFFVFFGFSTFIGIRGGFQDFPVNRSWVYYSKHAVLNQGATNGFWNLLDVLFNKEEKTNIYQFYTNHVSKAIVDSVYFSNNKPQQIFTIDKPNIILILMESWSANAIGAYGIKKGFSNGFDSLCQEGLLYSDFYASGFRTEQGIIALLCGFPAQPKTTIMRKYGKFEHLPNLVRELSRHGYHTSYFYSGDTEFANTQAFLTTSGFDIIYNQENFPAKRGTRWGAYDEELFNFQLKESVNLKEPFFSVIMTSTSHEMFTADVTNIAKGDDEPSRYLNTIYYSDSCLFDYIKKSKNFEWYKNTLFVITADHGHYNPQQVEYNTPARHHIPLLFYGEVLKHELKGKRSATTANQIDFSKTLSRQLGVEDTVFYWGNDFIGDSIKCFAFYTFDNGFGIKKGNNFVIYDHNQRKIIGQNADSIENRKLEQLGKAFLQQIQEKYLSFNN